MWANIPGTHLTSGRAFGTEDEDCFRNGSLIPFPVTCKDVKQLLGIRTLIHD
jgi:hypothetical protein